MRWVAQIPHVTYFGPPMVPMGAIPPIVISYVEVEATRLVDLEGLSQEEAATRMGVSRKTFSSDLRSARKKLATALVEGRPIQLGVGEYHQEGQKERERGTEEEQAEENEEQEEE